MSIKEYIINDSILIKDGFEMENIEKVNEIDLMDSIKIKEASNWPVLYIMYSEDKKYIYIGQTSNVVKRIKEHIANNDIRGIERIKELNFFLVVYYKKSNLSLICNLEDNLIRCAYAYEKISEGKRVFNQECGNNHNYYNKSKLESELNAGEIWQKLKEKGIVDKDFSEIQKHYMYKLSPLIELTKEQENVKIKTLKLLKRNKNVLINGVPGTGKTVLALNIAKTVKSIYNDDKEIVIVTPVKSFKETLEKVVKNIDSFKKTKIFTPIELANYYSENRKNIDYIIVDEAHRLKYCRNNGIYAPNNRDIVFWKLRNNLIMYYSNDKIKNNIERKKLIENCKFSPTKERINRKKKDGSLVEKMTLNKEAIGKYLKERDNNKIYESINQIDWIEAIGNKVIYMYDEMQSIRLEDLNKEDLYNRLEIKSEKDERILNLSETIRIKNKKYLNMIESILEIKGKDKSKSVQDFVERTKCDGEIYEFEIFNSFKEMKKRLEKKKKEEKASCRLLSGYYKDWESNQNKRNKEEIKEYDFLFEKKIKMKWNSKIEDWCNTADAINLKEIGCVHTIQGYDIDYAGVIIGDELYFDKQIRVNIDNYKDKAGKAGLSSKEKEEILLMYIKNIYRILLTRGIKGTYVYICNKELREELQKIMKKRKEEFYRLDEDTETDLMVAEDDEEYKVD